MVDTRLDREFDRAERQFEVSEARRTFTAQPPPTVRKARLTVEEAQARRDSGTLSASETAASVEVRSEPVRPADADAALRHARIGFVVVAVLVFLLVWIMQRRKGR